MSNCCLSTRPKEMIYCPECGTESISVTLRTLYHQLLFPQNFNISLNRFYFCPSKTCVIAYFSLDGIRFAKMDLRTYQEILQDMLCYCFDITAEDFCKALVAQRGDTITDFVKQLTKTGQCACEVKNPAGQCCLAKFKQLQQGRLEES